MAQGTAKKTIGILAAVLGVPGMILATYFMIKETVLRISLRRRGKVEDEKFWIFVGDRRNLID